VARKRGPSGVFVGDTVATPNRRNGEYRLQVPAADRWQNN